MGSTLEGVWRLALPGQRRPRSDLNRWQTLLCRASWRGAACGTRFRLRHCPTCSAVPVEPLRREVGDRPCSRAGWQRGGGCTVSPASEMSVHCCPVDPKWVDLTRVAGGRLSRVRRCPSVGVACARLCKTTLLGRLLLWTWASYLREEAERRGARPSLAPVASADATSPACDSYLVDPASSHMLVSKTKPCMSKYKRFYTVKLRMAH